MCIKECRHCKSEIPKDASFCVNCNQWQSYFYTLSDIRNILPGIAIIISLLAFYRDTLPPPINETAQSASLVERFELMVDGGCESYSSAQSCEDRMWPIYGAALYSISAVSKP